MARCGPRIRWPANMALDHSNSPEQPRNLANLEMESTMKAAKTSMLTALLAALMATGCTVNIHSRPGAEPSPPPEEQEDILVSPTRDSPDEAEPRRRTEPTDESARRTTGTTVTRREAPPKPNPFWCGPWRLVKRHWARFTTVSPSPSRPAPGFSAGWGETRKPLPWRHAPPSCASSCPDPFPHRPCACGGVGPLLPFPDEASVRRSSMEDGPRGGRTDRGLLSVL